MVRFKLGKFEIAIGWADKPKPFPPTIMGYKSVADIPEDIRKKLGLSKEMPKIGDWPDPDKIAEESAEPPSKIADYPRITGVIEAATSLKPRDSLPSPVSVESDFDDDLRASAITPSGKAKHPKRLKRGRPKKAVLPPGQRADTALAIIRRCSSTYHADAR